MAVEKLGVSTIVVCGHSGCSAMQALLGNPSSTHQRTPADEHLASWLAHAETSRAAFRGGRHPLAQSAAEKGFSRADQLAIVNVAVQTEIVAQHPLVRERHRRGDRPAALLGHLDGGRGDVHRGLGHGVDPRHDRDEQGHERAEHEQRTDHVGDRPCGVRTRRSCAAHRSMVPDTGHRTPTAPPPIESAGPARR